MKQNDLAAHILKQRCYYVEHVDNTRSLNIIFRYYLPVINRATLKARTLLFHTLICDFANWASWSTTDTHTHRGTHSHLHPVSIAVARWKMRLWTSQRGTLIPSEAANWCEWINHPQLSIQNTPAWANGRTPPARGEKLMCWWAASQIFTGQTQDCRLFHYLPVSHPVIWYVFLSISVSLCPSLSRSLSRFLSRSLGEGLAESARDEKKTKCLLIRQPCVTALSKSITLITQPKKNQPRGIKAKYPDL